MYYVIETKYVGPNQDRYIDADRIEISHIPAIDNFTKEPIIEGWCGETDGWSVYAHGEYSTVESAREYIDQKFGETREYDSHIVATYKPGRYEPLGAEGTRDWIREGVEFDIHKDITEGDIDALVEEYETSANEEGYTLDKDHAKAYMFKCRQDKCDEAEFGFS